MTPPKLNREWRLAHRMPQNPTREQRYDWQIKHAQNCACRPMPQKLRAEIEKARVAK